MQKEQKWLDWAVELQSLAQSALYYCKDKFDIERFERIREISAEMLVDAGVKYVVLGHSERRDYFKEDDALLNKKVKKAFEKGLTPILCCGETLEQREMGITLDWIRLQIKSDLKDVTAEQVASMVIAYEPIWAIGTGKTATTEQAEVSASQKYTEQTQLKQSVSSTVDL